MSPEDTHIERLKLVQTVVGRMAQNEFVVKGWAITLTGALLGFAVDRDSGALAVLALGPIAAFGALDTYYLSRQMLYRDFYEHLCTSASSGQSMSLDATAVKTPHAWFHAIWATPILIQYLGLAVLSLLVAALVSWG